MSELSEQKLDAITAQYATVPRDILAPAIDASGLVNTEQLGHILRAYQAGAAGRVEINTAKIVSLKTAYHEAKSRHDVKAMVCLKSQVFELGGSV